MSVNHSARFGNTDLVLVQGDITVQEVDAIVNAANSGLVGGGGVDGAIHRAGGPSIMQECDAIRASQGGCPTGNAVVTKAGNLPAQYVIHAVGPIWSLDQADECDVLLASAYRNSLARAEEIGAKRVAFPSISTGVYAFPIGRAAQIALRTVCETVIGRDFVEIRFVLFSTSILESFAAALATFQSQYKGS